MSQYGLTMSKIRENMDNTHKDSVKIVLQSLGHRHGLKKFFSCVYPKTNKETKDSLKLDCILFYGLHSSSCRALLAQSANNSKFCQNI